MNKEEILAMSRQENKNVDLVDKEIEIKSIATAGRVMTAVCIVLHIAVFWITGTKNSGFFGIAAIYNAVLFTMKGIKLNDRGKLTTGIIWSVLAVGLTIEYFYQILTTSGIL